MAKKRKKNKSSAKQPALTEWQKREVEFQERKQERQAAKERDEERLRQEKLAQIKAEIKKSQEEVQTEVSVDVTSLPITPSEDEEKGEDKPLSSSEEAQSRTRNPYKRAFPLVVSVLLVLLVSAFMVSPYSKMKHFVVAGAQQTDQMAVVAATGIKDSDYVTSVLPRLKAHEQALVKNNPWVKSAKMSYSFPNTFQLVIEEHPIVAYNLTTKGYRPVLANGEQIDDYADNQLPEGTLPLAFEKAKDRRQFIKQFMTLEPDLRESILEVNFAGSTSTQDLLLLTMAEGHLVRVPLSELSLKLPYYQSIKKKLLYPSIVDMEVGIYTTNAELEALAAETRASRALERQEAEALAKSQESETETSSRSRRANSTSRP